MRHDVVFVFLVWNLLLLQEARGCDGDATGTAEKINIYPTDGVMILNCTTKWTMMWMKGNITLLVGEERQTNDSRVELIAEGSQKNLRIKDVTRADEGVYSCCEFMPDERMVVAYDVTIVENMTFSGVSQSFVSVKNGTDVLLWCNATGHPKPTVRWYAVQNKERHYIGITGPLLRISGLDDICTTDYACIATNKACPPINHTMTVALEVAPRVFIDADDFYDDVTEEEEYLLVRTKRLGGGKKLTCSVDMNPVGNITWVVYHNWLGNASFNKDGKFTATKNLIVNNNYSLGPVYLPTFEAKTSSFTNVSLEMNLQVIEDVDFELNYTCIAANELGQDEWTVRFELIPKS